MGRHPFVRNNLLWISILVTLVGLAFVLFSYMADYDATNWTDPYESVVPGSSDVGSWNLAVKVIAPIVLVTGLWYLGEQIIYRRRFNRMLNAGKKSDFQKNVQTMEETARDLPQKYEERLKEKQASFKSRR